MPPAKSNPERLVSATRAEEENSFELKLRPRVLAEFIGQPKAKEQLAIALQAAKSRGEALDHVLLFGPPGLGKTTLASIIANELDVGFQQTSGPALQIQGDLTAILTNLRERQVLFLDEIHRLQPVLEEKLYTALEDYKLDIIIGQGPAARTHVMDIKPFTFVAATTRPGLLSSPLRSRFGILLRLEFYSEDDLRFIVERSAEVMQVPIDDDGAAEIAMRSRGTPRIANRLLRRVRDYAQVRGTGSIDRPTAEAALKMLGQIGRVDNIPKYIAKAKDKNDPFRLMGFGHRVYKNYDPRARIIKRVAYEVFDLMGKNPLLEIALECERIALEDDYFVKRKLYPNVDFYTGLIYQSMGFPMTMFPVLFAIPRTSGWIAQWEEMLLDPEQKIARPRQIYLGHDTRHYVPIEKRG